MSHVSLKAEILSRTRRLVVKVGSAVLSDANGLKAGVIGSLASQADQIMRDGRDVVLVTSGAIAAGRTRFGKVRGITIAARQAAAAVGQIELMAAWAQAFNEVSRPAAQILLTHQDLAEQRRRNNARNTIHTLLAAGVIPIINENDTVAVDEIRFGDNDMLSSLAASLVQAELLVIMTDVAGVLTGDPRKGSVARLIPLITNPDAPMRGLIAESAGPLGSGGMAAKFKAARQASRAGITVIITAGAGTRSLADVLDPTREAGTLIIPARRHIRSRKHWIAFALRPAGALMVDRGASDALRGNGRSLLASGIRQVQGEFAGGDCVSLIDPDGIEFGRGIVNYPAGDVLKVKGRRSNEIARLLGYKVADEIIHRDNLVLLENDGGS